MDTECVSYPQYFTTVVLEWGIIFYLRSHSKLQSMWLDRDQTRNFLAEVDYQSDIYYILVAWGDNPGLLCCSKFKYEPWHEISNNVVCATSKGSDQPVHTRRLIRGFASRLNIL